MTQHLSELVEQFCTFRRQQRGKTDGGVKTYRWNLEQFLRFVRRQYGRPARVTDLTSPIIQAWMDDMAGADLALSTMRVRQSTLSSLCAWLVKRDVLVANPVAKLDRPPDRREQPRQAPGSSIMDALLEAAKSAPTAARRGDLPDSALRRNAPGICSDVARASSRPRVGFARRGREGRQDAEHPPARDRDEVSRGVRRAGADAAHVKCRCRHAVVLVDLGPTRRRQNIAADDGQERVGALQCTDG
jgi:hypothetical protein